MNHSDKLEAMTCVQETRRYRGRFAPTPSGPLHLGSLLTALAGFLQARTARGAWLLRIDDLDVERSRREHAETILRQLEAHGLHWDETVRWQSQQVDEYEAAFSELTRRATLYACKCTRAMLAAKSLPGPDGPVYDGTCRSLRLTTSGRAMRLKVDEGRVQLRDAWQGAIERDLKCEIGDFILRRADGQIGYQLASVVDDSAQDITEVVRGSDLIGSSLRQIHLQRTLDLQTPAYRHLPILLDIQGRKLSKQNHASPLGEENACSNLMQCLSVLGQQPPDALHHENTEAVIGWAATHWRPDAVPRGRALLSPI